MWNRHPLADPLPFLYPRSLEKFIVRGVVAQTETFFVIQEFNQGSLPMSYNTKALA